MPATIFKVSDIICFEHCQKKIFSLELPQCCPGFDPNRPILVRSTLTQFKRYLATPLVPSHNNKVFRITLVGNHCPRAVIPNRGAVAHLGALN